MSRQEIARSLTRLNAWVDELSGKNDQHMRAIKAQISQSTKDLQKSIKGDATVKHLKDLHGAVKSALPALKKIASGGVEKSLSGVCDLLVSFTPLVCLYLGPISPAAGPLLAIVMSLVNGIVGLFASTGPSMGEILEDVINKALRRQGYHDMLRKADGVRQVFNISKAFLDGFRRERAPIREHEIIALSANLPICNGVAFLGELTSEIHRYGLRSERETKPKDVLAECRICVNYTTLYYQLALIQDALHLDLFTTIQAAGHSPHIAAGIWNARCRLLEEAKTTLRLLRKPECSPVIAALNIMEKNSGKESFLNYCGLPASDYKLGRRNMSGYKVRFRSESLRREGCHTYLCIETFCWDSIELEKASNLKGEEYFWIREVDELFCRIQSAKWHEKFVTLPNDYSGDSVYLETRKAEDIYKDLLSFFVMKKVSTGNYLVCPKMTPDKFLCADPDRKNCKVRSDHILGEGQYKLRIHARLCQCISRPGDILWGSVG